MIESYINNFILCALIWVLETLDFVSTGFCTIQIEFEH